MWWIYVVNKKIRPEPVIEKCRRVGTRKSDGSGRPIKVTFQNMEFTKQMLQNSKMIKDTLVPGYSFQFKNLYLAPDRTEEERKKRKELVEEIKEKIREDPSKKYYIKDNKVNVVTEDSGS